MERNVSWSLGMGKQTTLKSHCSVAESAHNFVGSVHRRTDPWENPQKWDGGCQNEVGWGQKGGREFWGIGTKDERACCGGGRGDLRRAEHNGQAKKAQCFLLREGERAVLSVPRHVGCAILPPAATHASRLQCGEAGRLPNRDSPSWTGANQALRSSLLSVVRSGVKRREETHQNGSTSGQSSCLSGNPMCMLTWRSRKWLWQLSGWAEGNLSPAWVYAA